MGEREGRRGASGAGRRSHQEHQQQQAELRAPPLPPPAPGASAAPSGGARRRAELTRTLSMVDVCAVCLEEVRERATRLPCSHKYHSECVLPWLAIHPDCPCCRALVPAALAA